MKDTVRTKKERIFLKHLITVLIVITALVFGYFYSKKDLNIIRRGEGLVSVHFVDVGQGNAGLIITESMTVLIDAAPISGADDLAAYLGRYKINKIDYMILTHFDEDHIGGARTVFEHVNSVDTVIIPHSEPDSRLSAELFEYVSHSDSDLLCPEDGEVIPIGEESQLKFFANLGSDSSDSNDSSLVVKLTSGEIDVLFPADISAEIEKNLVESRKNELNCEIITASHHGSKYSNTEEFIRAVSPEYVIISSSKNNSYGHPHKEALDNFALYTDNIYRTDKHGNIVMITNKKDVRFYFEKSDKK